MLFVLRLWKMRKCLLQLLCLACPHSILIYWVIFFRRSLSIRVSNFAPYLCHVLLNPHQDASALQHLEMCTDLLQHLFQLFKTKIDFSQSGMWRYKVYLVIHSSNECNNTSPSRWGSSNFLSLCKHQCKKKQTVVKNLSCKMPGSQVVLLLLEAIVRVAK